jgi:hypothetical protein
VKFSLTMTQKGRDRGRGRDKGRERDKNRYTRIRINAKKGENGRNVNEASTRRGEFGVKVGIRAKKKKFEGGEREEREFEEGKETVEREGKSKSGY